MTQKPSLQRQPTLSSIGTETLPSRESCFYCGLLSGTLQAGIFNPWDRALYLAHLNKRPFLSRANFHRPYEGFHQSILHRIISGGMYFPLEDIFRTTLPEKHGPVAHNFVCGVGAGSMISLVTNPLSAIKYQSWGSAHKGQMIRTAVHMLARGGPGSFFRAIHTTLIRDIVWGGSYAVLRNWFPVFVRGEKFRKEDLKPGWLSLTSNILAGAIGTVLSSPFNYARNMQYGRKVHLEGHSIRNVFEHLLHDARMHKEKTGMSHARYMARRMAIGWGTLRVALGLGFSSQVYGVCLSYM